MCTTVLCDRRWHHGTDIEPSPYCLSDRSTMLRNIGTAVDLTRYPRELHAHLHHCMHACCTPRFACEACRSTPLSMHLVVGFETSERTSASRPRAVHSYAFRTKFLEDRHQSDWNTVVEPKYQLIQPHASETVLHPSYSSVQAEIGLIGLLS